MQILGNEKNLPKLDQERLNFEQLILRNMKEKLAKIIITSIVFKYFIYRHRYTLKYLSYKITLFSCFLVNCLKI